MKLSLLPGLFAVLLSWSAAVSVADAGEPVAFGGLQPRISPDGKWFAVSYQGGIWKGSLTAGLGKLIQLTAGGPWDVEPVWSPDGTGIAFFRGPNGVGGELKIVDAGSGAEIALPKKIRGQGKLFYDADGTRLLGYLGDANFSGRPAWLDLKSGEISPLPIGPEDAANVSRKRMKFALSPDGKTIAYAIHRDEFNEQGGNRGPQADVWTSASDGTAAELRVTWPARIYDLGWDGNGACLMVTDLGTVHNDVWRLPLKNSLAGAGKITHGQSDQDRPSLDAAGRQMIWTDNADGATKICLLDRDLGAVRDWVPTAFQHAGPTGRIKVKIRDGNNGGAVAARLSIQDTTTGKIVAPPASLYRLTGAVGHFYVSSDIDFEVPAGTYRMRAFRGAEYRVAEQEISVEAGATSAAAIDLERWIDMAGDQWFSGENHVHANYGYGEWYNSPETVLRQCQGENLNVCNAVIANSDGDAVFDREFFLGQVDPRSTDDTLIYWGQEFRSTLWGHMTLSNLSQLVEPVMTGFPGTTNPWDVPTNADIAQRTIDQKGLIGYTHPAGNRLDLYDQPYSAKGMPVDAALGRVQLMDVMGHTYEGSTQLWYRLMNCGLRVVASSGTDVFLNRVRSMPPGWARTYVHLPDGLDYRKWTAGQAAGRSFITSAPMLEFEVNGKLGMGAEVKLESPGKIAVRAAARSQFAMDRVELVHNGEVIESLQVTPGDGGFAASFDGELEIAESGWLAVRAHGPATGEVIREPAAHSNPVWIEVSGTANSIAKKDADYFLKWIDRLQADFETRGRIPNDEIKRRVLHQLEQARKFYRGVRES